MKFKIGDKARVCDNVGKRSDSFLEHVFDIGREVEVSEIYHKWKGYEAYCIKGSSEILLAEELEYIK